MTLMEAGAVGSKVRAAVSENYVNVMIINYDWRSLSAQMNENSFLSNSLM